MNEKLADALNEVRDSHIQEAAKPKKSKKKLVLRVAAAAAMVALVVGIALTPPRVTATAVSLPEESRSNGSYDKARVTSEALSDFYVQASAQFLDGTENGVWSPANAFIGLAMVAELAQGESRQQILDLFGVENIETLRSYATDIWEAAYHDKKNQESSLENSLWLDETLSYEQQAMDDLSYYYYASVYKGEMGSKKMNNAIGAWLERNTGGMLKKSSENVSLSPETVMAIYSTIYFQSKWEDEFSKSDNTEGTFHSPAGDTTVTYMNKDLAEMNYYWADHFSAVCLGLKNGSEMWFILPDEGYTTDDILTDGEYMQMVTGSWENCKAYKVNLSVPKFDITSGLNLQQGLEEMGVTDVFNAEKSDFSALTADVPVYLTGANQNVRLTIDEEGVKGAVYIEIPGAGAMEPPQEIVDFVLDRPFVFVVSARTVPLFVGTVAEP